MLQELIDAAHGEAAKCPLLTSPNPKVGCVIARDGQVVARGYTQRAGESHAEVRALLDAKEKGVRLDDAVMAVTLEPCNHTGRTGPCTEAIIASGIKTVIAACSDPNPLVAGGGFRRLEAAGVKVICLNDDTQTRAANRGFFSRMERGIPYVTVKTAASLNGVTALSNGKSKWITSEAARQDVHRFRMVNDAVMTGIGTVLADNPQLNVRLPDAVRQPMKVICDTRLRMPPTASVVGGAPTVVFTCSDNTSKISVLEDKGVRVIQVDANNNGKVSISAVLKNLAKMEINELFVEAGAALAGSVIGSGFADRLLVYLAPSLLGGGRGMFGLGDMVSLDERVNLTFEDITRVGYDLRILATVEK